MPVYDLPPKILCRVVNLMLKVVLQFLGFRTKLVYEIIKLLFYFIDFFLTKKFQAEPDTDEVFAQVTLLPEPNVSLSTRLGSWCGVTVQQQHNMVLMYLLLFFNMDLNDSKMRMQWRKRLRRHLPRDFMSIRFVKL